LGRAIFRVFIYLTSCFPFSYQGEGEDFIKRGFAPLRLPGKMYPEA